MKNGKIFNQRDGGNSSVHISFSGITDKRNLVSVHNHPIHGFNAPSDIDIDKMLHNPYEKYCIVVSENKIWVIRNKNHYFELKKMNTEVYMNSINIVGAIKIAFEENKINELKDIRILEYINNKTDKEITDIFNEYTFYSEIIKINNG